MCRASFAPSPYPEHPRNQERTTANSAPRIFRARGRHLPAQDWCLGRRQTSTLASLIFPRRHARPMLSTAALIGIATGAAITLCVL